MKKNYKASNGARFSDKQAQEYGEFLSRLSKEKKNMLSPDDIVNAARPDDSPLHDFFEWKDSIAAELYRKNQARHMINHINIIVTKNDKEKPIKAFFNVEYRGKENTYVPINVIARVHTLKEQVVKRALDEIIAWQRRYKDYKELDRIFGAIKETQKELRI